MRRWWLTAVPVLTVLCAAAGLSAGGGLAARQREAQRPKSWAVIVPVLEKLRADSPLRGALEVDVSVARGECEGFQVVTAPELAAPATLRSEPLQGPTARLELSWYRIGFIPVKTPSNQEGGKGEWADALLPLEAQTPETKKRQAFYGEVCVPEAQAPGHYSGSVRVAAEDQPPVVLPVRVEVQPFTLPATSSLPNSFGISLYSIARAHGLSPESEEARALMHDYVRTLLSHRVSAHGMSMQPPAVRFEEGRARVDFSGYDQEVGPYLDGTALPSGARFTTIDFRDSRVPKTDEEKRAYREAVRAHHDAKGWKAFLFFYAKDEPKPEERPLVLRQSQELRAAKVPVLITSPDDPTLTPAADILAPTLNCFFAHRGPPTCKAVRSIDQLRRHVKGRVWWYQSCNSHGCQGGPAEARDIERAYSGWASYMVDHPAPLNRAMGPLAFFAGVDGELYFDTVYAYNTKDPWTDLFEFGGNGDGTLFYPGTPSKLGTSRHVPVVSLRLKHIRDGLEDYEYLKALRDAGEGDFARRAVRRWVQAGDAVTRNPAEWQAVRSEMTQRLRQVWQRRNKATARPSGKEAGP